MAELRQAEMGRVVAIWRYPVKSMMGEELNAAQVTQQGLLGDRAYALVDVETGKVASAKNPRRWPNLFQFRASYITPPDADRAVGPVRIELPDGQWVTSDQADAATRISSAVGRPVRLARLEVQAAGVSTAEDYWPEDAGLPQREEITDFELLTGTLFDGAAVHLVTTATLDRLRVTRPANRFEVPRFRPNLVIEPAAGLDGFVEERWIGKIAALGEVRLSIDRPCPRCVMTTLEQGSLPRDVGVLQTAVKENRGNVGVYATVLGGGRIRRGDSLQVHDP